MRDTPEGYSWMGGVNETSPLRHALAALAEGDEGAQMLNTIRFYLYRAGLAGERELALEIFHETVATALAAEHRYDPTRSARAWLLGIAAHIIQRRRSHDFRQSKNEMQASDLAISYSGSSFGSYERGGEGGRDEEQLFERLLRLAQAGSSASDLALADPEQALLARVAVDELLAPLSDDDRRVIAFNLLYEMNGEEVAQALDTSPVAARVRFHRALKRLRAGWMARASHQEETQSDGREKWPRGDAHS